MKRADLEHLIAASATISGDDEIVVIGSQAMLAEYPHAPDELLESMEADLYPLHRPDQAEAVRARHARRAYRPRPLTGRLVKVRHTSKAVVERGDQPRRRAMDLVIAATANVAGIPLQTHKTADFLLIDDLVRVTAP